MRLFGADGIRGTANEILTPELVFALGRAMAAQASSSETAKPSIVIGRDPRPSSEMLEGALVSGLCSGGADVLAVGVAPTAAVAFIAAQHDAAAGVVVTASHNPLEDNGLKVFGRGGWKYSDEAEIRLEEQVAMPQQGAPRPTGVAVGRRREAASLLEQYLDDLIAGLPSLSGHTAVVDSANGAGATIASEAYRRAGVEVRDIASDTSGNRINVGVGSTNIDHLRRHMPGDGHTIGLAHDGDADRLIAMDELGNVLDGSHLLAILAWDRRLRDIAGSETIVTSAMTNSGLAVSLAAHGIKVLETAVGDRHVLRAMREGRHALGGENYGHLILLDRATTGDGIRTALELLAVASRRGRSLSSLSQVWSPRPQVQLDIKVADRQMLVQNPWITDIAAREKDRLHPHGRLLVRMSTIEPVVRVMCEATTAAQAREVAEYLAEQINSVHS